MKYRLIHWLTPFTTARSLGMAQIRLLAKNVLQEDYADPVPRPDEDRMPGLLPREGFSAYAYLVWRN